VYVYDEMQKALLAQITLIWRDYFQRGHMYKLSNGRSFGGHDLWVRVSSVFSREKGLLNWPWQANEWHTPSVEDNVIRFFLDHASNDDRLNLIELVFSSFAQTLPEPVAELNERLHLCQNSRAPCGKPAQHRGSSPPDCRSLPMGAPDRPRPVLTIRLTIQLARVHKTPENQHS
jgi:hypothetical protein